ncbi:MAG: sensor histidine kinase [Lachnospiraceae bacterium]|nr:sensor histidine kinase [Lachnospiraceae bacterium]
MKSKKAFREMSIKKQARNIMFAVLILFVVVCGLISVSIRQLIFRNEDEHMQVSLLRLYDQIRLNYDKIENFCINISENEEIREFMMSDYSQMSDTIGGATECLTRHMILEPMIKDISLVNNRIHYSNMYRANELDEIRSTVNGDPFSWLGFRSHGFLVDSQKPDMMVYAGDIIVGTKNIGTIVLSIDASDFFSENDREANQVYFLAGEERVLFTPDQMEERVEEAYQTWIENRQKEHLKTGDYSIRSYYLEDMDCYLISVLDIRSTGEGTERIQILIWECVLQSAVFCIIFFLMLTRGIVRPLRQFHDTILQIRQSKQRGLKTDLNLKGCAEITELGYEFTGMLADIEKLNRQIFQSAMDLYELKVQKQEAELAYLRSQIDPHFLYNTLEVIRKMALEKNSPEIAQMAVDMGNIFRYSAKGEDKVTLEEEIAIIKSYIRIQQMRFAGKIEVFYFISEEVLCLRVMKMLLQPIVENSIFHGLEPKNQKGSLYIGARREEETLVITVKDDGVGIAKEKLDILQRELVSEHADTREHVGTLNTNARIKLYYGKEYGVFIESCPEDGTTVILKLPAKDS